MFLSFLKEGLSSKYSAPFLFVWVRGQEVTSHTGRNPTAGLPLPLKGLAWRRLRHIFHGTWVVFTQKEEQKNGP